MDFVPGLPIVKGQLVIIVVVDRLTKYCHLGSLSAGYSATLVTDYFIKQIVHLHDIPKSIVSDRDKVFVSKFWREIFAKSGTTLKMSTAYHPKTNGQTEIANKMLEQYMRATIQDNPRRWVDHRPFEFQVGEWVWLCLQPYRQNLVNPQTCQKLAKRFFGPFLIKAKISTVAYRLLLSDDCTIHPVFHIGLLKPYVGEPPTQIINPLPHLSRDSHPIIYPAKIIAHRLFTLRGKPVCQLLVEWARLPLDQRSWED